MMRKTQFMVQSALIAAIYAALCFSSMAVSFGPFQFRLAEALTVLPFFTPAAIPGLFIGCIVANLFSPFGIVDILCGSLASLIAATLTWLAGRWIKNRKAAIAVAPLAPVVVNGLIVGAVLTYMLAPGSGLVSFFTFAGQVALGELAVCYIIGVPLMIFLEKSKLAQRFFRLDVSREIHTERPDENSSAVAASQEDIEN